jgi:iron complex transport system permease protein
VTNSVEGGASGSGLLAAFAFVGALAAVVLTYSMGMAGERVRTPSALILAGVAVTAFLAAIQTYLLQRNVETIREVYTWILGSLATTGWGETLLLLPYAVVAITVVVALRRRLDILAVGDDEAASLGLDPRRSRYMLIGAASLGTAAAVSVSGLIGFVGIIVPHAIRLLAGSSYRAIVPLSALFGAAFLSLSDLAARTVLTPTEVPIGIVTAFLGAPFFVVILRTARRVGL